MLTTRATTVLWDIDGTLVHSGGVAAQAFLDAVAEVTGTRPTSERRDYGGRLDTEIAEMLLTAAGAELTLVPEVLAALRRFGVSSPDGSLSCGHRPAFTPAWTHCLPSRRSRAALAICSS